MLPVLYPAVGNALASSLRTSSYGADTPFPAYTAYAEVDLQAIRHNTRLMAQMAAPARLMAVVKANAYGHGAVQVASTLEEEGVAYFMVATLAEALQLRNNGIRSTILVANPPHPANLEVFQSHELHASIASPEHANALLDAADGRRPLHVHVKIDTGMGRLGVKPADAPHLIPKLLAHPGIRLEGLWTHLATAMSPDRAFAIDQIETARAVYRPFADRIPRFHAGNSSGLLNLPDHIGRSENELVRIGGALLGMSALPDAAQRFDLKPALSLKARILQLKTLEKGQSVSYGREWIAPAPRRIATVGAGYADGYPSRFETPPCVWIEGQTYPVAGRVCMDMLMVDLGAPEQTEGRIAVYDEVTLFGSEHPVLADLAASSGNKLYEICCNISDRVPRRYG